MSGRACVLCTCLIAAGCAGTETGNPSITAQLALDAHSSEPRRVAIGAADADIVVTQAWLAVGPVGLVSGEACAPGGEALQAPALGAADHARPDVAIVDLDVQPGAYCAVTIAFDRAVTLPSGAPPELDAHSIVLVGTLPDGASFTVASRLERTIAVTAVNGSFALDAERSAMLVGFDVARWLSRVDFTLASRDAGGNVVVDESSNTSLLESFEAELAAGIEVYRDRDADGALDEAPELLGRGAP